MLNFSTPPTIKLTTVPLPFASLVILSIVQRLIPNSPSQAPGVPVFLVKFVNESTATLSFIGSNPVTLAAFPAPV